MGKKYKFPKAFKAAFEISHPEASNQQEVDSRFTYADWKVPGSIPVKGMYIGCGHIPSGGGVQEAAGWCFSLIDISSSLSLSLPLCKKSMICYLKNFMFWKFKFSCHEDLLMEEGVDTPSLHPPSPKQVIQFQPAAIFKECVHLHLNGYTFC